MVAVVRERLSKTPERIALRGRRNGDWWELTRAEVDRTVRAAAAGLIELGVAEGARVGIIAANRPEWTIADLAIQSVRAVPVPIYPTLTVLQAAYIARDAEVDLLFVDGGRALQTAREIAAEHRPTTVVCFDDSAALDPSAREMSLSALMECGRHSARSAEVEERLERVTPEDLLTLIYTSGTTGEPKGVMLSQANLMAAMEIHDERLPEISDADTSLCFLPLSHVFERCWTTYCVYRGITVSYLDDPTQVIEVLQQVRPTCLCTVPRLLEKVHSAVHDRLGSVSALRRGLFDWAVRVGREVAARRNEGRKLSPALALQHAVANRLVLAKIRSILGGRLRLVPCAGAPLGREVEEFFHAVGVHIAHGYGLTETTATVSFHDRVGYRLGTVGRPMPRVQVSIGAGDEILVKGPTVMAGYYRKPEATAEVFRDGWFCTGDAGAIDEAGCIIITGRVKDLIKTSTGKYIAPQAIEAMLTTRPPIEQAAVVGDLRKYVVALIVPSFPALEAEARRLGLEWSTPAELVGRPEMVALVQARVDEVNRELANFEQVKRFALLAEPFVVEAGELTPTLKIRRSAIAARYADVIASLYRG
jgi:long-chain acyl-CoA synthetase